MKQRKHPNNFQSIQNLQQGQQDMQMTQKNLKKQTSQSTSEAPEVKFGRQDIKYLSIIAVLILSFTIIIVMIIRQGNPNNLVEQTSRRSIQKNKIKYQNSKNQNSKNFQNQNKKFQQIKQKKQFLKNQVWRLKAVEAIVAKQQKPQKNQVIRIKNQDQRNKIIDSYYNPGYQERYHSLTEKIRVVKVVKAQKDSTPSANKLDCIVINALDKYEGRVISVQKKMQSIINYANMFANQVTILWLIDSKQDQNQEGYYKSLINFLRNIKLPYQSQIVQLDSTYSFMTKYIRSKKQVQEAQKWIMYIGKRNIYFSQFLQTTQLNNKQNPFNYIEQNNSKNNTFVYVLDLQTGNKYSNAQKLSIINSSDQQLNNHVFLFKISMLKVITPVSFGFQNVYNFVQLIIRPIMTVARMHNKVEYLNKTLIAKLKLDQNQKTVPVHLKQFILKRLGNKVFSQNPSVPLCFLAVPTVLNTNSEKQLIQYLRYFNNLLDNNKPIATQRINLIFPLVYQQNQGQSNHLIQFISQVFAYTKIGLNIRLKIRQFNISTALQVYDISRSFCHLNSLIFSSRLNVAPSIQNLVQLSFKPQMCVKHYLIFGNYVNQKQQTVGLDWLTPQQQGRTKSTLIYYNSHFKNAQFFCCALGRQMLIQITKWVQLQFFQSQSSFMTPFIERGRHSHYNQKQLILYKLKYLRNQTQKQKIQFKRLANRNGYINLNQSPLNIRNWDQLNNYAYRRNAPPIVSKIIHQVWLSNSKQIAPMRKATIQTIKNNNPDYYYKLWTLETMNRQNFPISFDAILRFQQIQDQFNKNYRALIADIMRIQALYLYGGIYLDLKIQSKKSLDPFLKYEQFYLIVNQDAFTNGLIGSSSGNRRFKKILQDFFRPELMGIPKPQIFSLTGGSKIIQAFSYKQVYTQVLNFAPFIVGGTHPCANSNQTEPDPDQKMFTGVPMTQNAGSQYRVFIPCKEDEDKYAILYDIIGRSYHHPKQSYQ